jgi:hypothetical protein
MRMEQIDHFTSTEADSVMVRVTDTHLIILTGRFDLESIAHALLASKPLYFNGDPWTYTDKCHSLANSQKIRLQTSGYDNLLVKIDDSAFSPTRSVSAYGAMKHEGKDIPRRPRRLSYTLDLPWQLDILEREVNRKVVADPTLKHTTTVTMPAEREQSPRDEPAEKDHQNESWADGFGSIDLDDLWAQRVDEPLKPIAGFDLATKLEEMGVLAGEPKIADVFTHYPLSECPFNAQHRKVVLSQHRSGTVTYLCPHHSCRGQKQGFERKTARDYFAYYGVTIPGIS